MEPPHRPQYGRWGPQPDDAVLLVSRLDPPSAAVVAGRACRTLDVHQLNLRADRATDHGAASFRSLGFVETMGRWAAGPRVGRYARTAGCPCTISVLGSPARRMLSLAVVPAYAGRVADRVAECRRSRGHRRTGESHPSCADRGRGGAGAKRPEPSGRFDNKVRRIDVVRLSPHRLVLDLDRPAGRAVPVRVAHDDRVARGHLLVDLRDDQPEPPR